MNNEKHYINSIYYQLEQTAKYCRYLGTQLFQKLNLPITIEEFSVLDTLMLNADICQRDLAKLILKDRPSTGRILNSLEEKDLIKRFADTKNNRLVRKILLTDKGKHLLAEITEILKKYLNKLPESLSPARIEDLKNNIRTFREILEKEVEMNI